MQAVLKEITIESYKSLKNVTVQFKDGLNIIIGKNGSGKSNLLEAIKTYHNLRLFDTRYKKNQHDFHFSLLFEKEESDKTIHFSLKAHRVMKRQADKSILSETSAKITKQNIGRKTSFYNKKISYKEPFKDISDKNAKDELYVLVREALMRSVTLLQFNLPSDLNWLDIQGSYEIDSDIIFDKAEGLSLTLFWRYELEFELNFDVTKFNAAYANKIKKSFLSNFILFLNSFRIIQNLKEFSPIKDIRINKNINIYLLNDKIIIENVLLEFENENGNWMPWSFLADGTKRLFYLITEMSMRKNNLILIEEPELGIHPHQLYKLMRFIKEQSEEKQIIISTHSPLVLDTLDEDELDRITIAKIENGSSKFIKLTEEQTVHAKRYMHEQMDLSFYWLHADMEEQE